MQASTVFHGLRKALPNHTVVTTLSHSLESLDYNPRGEGQAEESRKETTRPFFPDLTGSGCPWASPEAVLPQGTRPAILTAVTVDPGEALLAFADILGEAVSPSIVNHLALSIVVAGIWGTGT
jgi:hypothetical protein